MSQKGVEMLEAQCQFCSSPLNDSFCDLGMSPLSNAFLKKEKLQSMEPFYPLHVRTCSSCFLVQLQEFQTPEQIFSDYAYFSSLSKTWLDHAKNYTEAMIKRFHLNPSSQVIEIASNDGYLLQYFLEKKIPVLGIEPAENVAKVSMEKGIPNLVKFFGVNTARELASQGKHADLLLGNNVLAHVPNLKDFIGGMKIVLKPQGVITMEFPHLLKLMEGNQFDTIYHEHFSYLSLIAIEKIFASFGLVLFDVDEIPTHGGSLRIYIKHVEDHTKSVNESLNRLRSQEQAYGLNEIASYRNFAEKVRETKRKFVNFLIEAKQNGKTIAGYGAPAKGNTLLNYCGIRTDFIDYTVDLSSFKQGRYLPGTHIPIEHPDKIKETKPDYLVILPWNIKEEIIHQMAHIREWGGKFVVPIPSVEVIS
jgi:2-polyprenyl-3-methyl-5-hydroxy-6-metoxy-1,4-benzoquinol methylase